MVHQKQMVGIGPLRCGMRLNWNTSAGNESSGTLTCSRNLSQAATNVVASLADVESHRAAGRWRDCENLLNFFAPAAIEKTESGHQHIIRRSLAGRT